MNGKTKHCFKVTSRFFRGIFMYFYTEQFSMFT